MAVFLLKQEMLIEDTKEEKDHGLGYSFINIIIILSFEKISMNRFCQFR